MQRTVNPDDELIVNSLLSRWVGLWPHI